ncbi:hypothetical protein IFM89_021825 [Coptis chinensis]|uniref:FRIGIDA-like protein n=1 Tax=Coptis chinensis TaxID=261450 RepID=A0A835I4B9_9MAGN|nr:hypothetical protein IFM89_021825 [Coptis chinensis]
MDLIDALQGFYPLKSKKARGGELGVIRRTCVLLLEGLELVKPVISEEAKKLAVDWRGKVTVGSDDQLEALVFLQLLASYGLVNEFNVDEVLDLLFLLREGDKLLICLEGLVLVFQVF